MDKRKITYLLLIANNKYVIVKEKRCTKSNFIRIKADSVKQRNLSEIGKDRKGKTMNIKWDDLKNEINLSEDEKEAVRLEESLIETMVHIREEQGMSQAQLAEVCNVKQPAIARMEKGVHSPQVGSLLKLLVPLGYTLKIVPITNSQKSR